MSTLQRRKHLFEVFAQHAKNVFKECVEDGFYCPMCADRFSAEDLDSLQLAHIIPEAVGGKDHTLSCKGCDSWIGGTYNLRLLRIRDALQAFTKGEKYLIYGDISYRFKDLIYGKTRVSLDVIKDVDQGFSPLGRRDFFGQTRLEFVEKVLEHSFPDASEIVNLDLSIDSTFDNWERSYWHSLFLMAFHVFGYRFAAAEIGKAIYAEIRQPGSARIPEEALQVKVVGRCNLSKGSPPLSLRYLYGEKCPVGLVATFPHLIDEIDDRFFYLKCPFDVRHWEAFMDAEYPWGPNLYGRNNNHLKLM